MERIFERWCTNIELNQNRATIYLWFREYSIIQWSGLSKLSPEEYFLEIWWIVIWQWIYRRELLAEIQKLKLREAQSILVQTTQDYLRKHQRKRSVDGGPKNLEVTKFAPGEANVSQSSAQQVAGMYRGPKVVTSIDRPDLIKVRDLITSKESMVLANRIRTFKHPKEKIETLAATDLEEFYVEKAIGHSGMNPKKLKFRVRWIRA